MMLFYLLHTGSGHRGRDIIDGQSSPHKPAAGQTLPHTNVRKGLARR